jgi:hypothetical protein
MMSPPLRPSLSPPQGGDRHCFLVFFQSGGSVWPNWKIPSLLWHTSWATSVDTPQGCPKKKKKKKKWRVSQKKIQKKKKKVFYSKSHDQARTSRKKVRQHFSPYSWDWDLENLTKKKFLKNCFLLEISRYGENLKKKSTTTFFPMAGSGFDPPSPLLWRFLFKKRAKGGVPWLFFG